MNCTNKNQIIQYDKEFENLFWAIWFIFLVQQFKIGSYLITIFIIATIIFTQIS